MAMSGAPPTTTDIKHGTRSLETSNQLILSLKTSFINQCIININCKNNILIIDDDMIALENKVGNEGTPAVLLTAQSSVSDN